MHTQRRSPGGSDQASVAGAGCVRQDQGHVVQGGFTGGLVHGPLGDLTLFLMDTPCQPCHLVTSPSGELPQFPHLTIVAAHTHLLTLKVIF